MLTHRSLVLVAFLTTACNTANNCGLGPIYQCETPTTSSSQTTLAETHDALAFEETESGVLAVVSNGSTGEVRTYRVEATEVDEAPFAVTLASQGGAEAPAHVADRALVTLDDASAYVHEGDAYLRTGVDADYARIGAPGITRAVAIADVRGEHTTRRVVAVLTESPRMVVFFPATDTTNPSAFEPLE
jgi:hypothetical protein